MSLVLHRGAVLVTRSDLAQCHTPQGSGRWRPVSHIQVLNTVETTLSECGFEVNNAQYGLMKDGGQFFGTLDLSTQITQGVSLSVGIRNSTNKTLPLGFIAGNRVFVCDNLAFSAELLVKRRHTTFGEMRFQEAIAHAVRRLSQFRQEESSQISLMQSIELSDTEAESYILRAYERRIVSHLLLPDVIHQWREPSHKEFEDRTAWSLFNAFTHALNPRAVSSPIAAFGLMQLANSPKNSICFAS